MITPTIVCHQFRPIGYHSIPHPPYRRRIVNPPICTVRLSLFTSSRTHQYTPSGRLSPSKFWRRPSICSTLPRALYKRCILSSSGFMPGRQVIIDVSFLPSSFAAKTSGMKTVWVSGASPNIISQSYVWVPDVTARWEAMAIRVSWPSCKPEVVVEYHDED